MKQVSKSAIAVATFACAAIVSFGWSEQGDISLSVQSAQARVGRPLTPVSVAGVARRQNRRAGYYYTGAGNYGVTGISASRGGEPSYSGGALAPRLYVAPNYYYNPYVAGTTDTWYAVRAYYMGGPWSGTPANGWGYSWTGWDDYAQRNGIGCTPGNVAKGGDGINYVCQ